MKKFSRVEMKRRRRRFFLRTILLFFLFSITSILALNSDFFTIEGIKVLGNNKISAETLIDGSSISIGENIFKINIRTIKKDLATLPYIKEINIKRKLPKEIIIDIIERKEIIQIKSISSYFLMDIDGYILDIVEERAIDLPLLIGIDIENSKVGSNISELIEREEKLEFIKEGHAIQLLNKIKDIDMEDYNNINIELIGGITVAFGTLDNVEYKLRILNEIIKDVEEKQILCKMILMNRGDNPIVVVEEEEEG